jgi:arylsulfatase A-like enzyme
VHAAATEHRAAVAAKQDTSPNIILFMTDDQNRNELRWMPKTVSLLGDHGVTFKHAMSPAPLCCPARAMTITGQYGQNNGVQFNSGPYGGLPALRDPDNTLGLWLQGAGYQTALVGKYLNGYDHGYTPPVAGWTRWNPSVRGIYNYFGTTFLDGDGTKTYAGSTTRAIAGYTERDIRAFSATGQPFFLWVSHLAPHAATLRPGSDIWVPPKPTARYADVLGDVVSPARKKPSFNVIGQDPAPYPDLPLQRVARMQAEFTGRIRALQDVDDALQRMIAVLRDTGELDSTYIIFVSDNAELLGEHRILGKNVLYHEDLEVPLIVRAPDVTTRVVMQEPVTVVDLAPTILALADASPGRTMDGESFAPLLHGDPTVWRDTQLIQTGSTRTDGPSPGWDMRGVWTSRFTYMQRVVDGAEFLYDRTDDPYELVNRAPSSAYQAVLVELRRRYDALAGCAGASCNQDFGPVPSVGTTP